MTKPRAIMIALAAITIAITTVFTLLVHIPTAVPGGYMNISDVAIYFTAFTFGPWLGGVAGGIGAAIADILSGAPQFALLTLLAHGLQGLVAGAIARRGGMRTLLLGWLVGTLIMVGLYFVGEPLLGITWQQALTEVPWNVLQNVIGAAVSIPLFYAVRKAYPPVTQMAEPKKWREG